MKRERQFFLALAALPGLILLFLVFGAVSNFWSHWRLPRAVVEVAESSLAIGEEPATEGLRYVLRLHLRSGGHGLLTHEQILSHASYPDEAYDELRFWAPGSRREVYLLSGDRPEIRLLTTDSFPEFERGVRFSAASLFVLAVTAVLSGMAFGKNVVKRLIPGCLLLFGLIPVAGALLFSIYAVPQYAMWPRVTAVGLVQPPEPPKAVSWTPAARTRLSAAPYRVIRFTHAGRTLHGGIGAFHGAYDVLDARCGIGKECQFWMDPSNRWDVLPERNVSEMLTPIGLAAVFGGAFIAAGLLGLRRR
jgi:hypothetical protein